MSYFVDTNINNFLSNPFEKRKSIAERIIRDYDGYIPIIIGRAELKNTPTIRKYKYVASREMTFGNFIVEIKKNIDNIDANTNIFVFFPDNRLVPISDKISYLYDKYKNKDGFLYLFYSIENTFG